MRNTAPQKIGPGSRVKWRSTGFKADLWFHGRVVRILSGLALVDDGLGLSLRMVSALRLSPDYHAERITIPDQAA